MLQQLDLARERRLRHVEQRGGAAEVQFGGDRHETSELAELEHDSDLEWRDALYGLDAVAVGF